MPKEEHKRIIKYGNNDPDDMLALVSGKVLRETKKKLKGRTSQKLTDGKRYGYLALVMSDRKGAHYRCECDCGGAVYLTRQEILERERLRAGCLGFDCRHGAEEVKAWRNPMYSLWLQLRMLLKEQPENVDNAWGGSAYDELERESFSAGFDNLAACAKSQIIYPTCRWWMSRDNKMLPYSPFNLTLVSTPEIDLFGSRSRYVRHGRNLYSVNNLATLYDIPLRDIQRWKREAPNDEALMEIILRESETE